MIVLAEMVSPDKLINGAKQLGELTTTEIWALLSLVLTLALVYMIRQNSQAGQRANDMRLEDVQADMKVAAAIEKLADEIQELRHDLPASTSSKGEPHA